MADYVNMGANIVAFEKEKKKYGMTCAWCMQCDYEELLLLIGSQSCTGHHLNVGDRVGISALSKGQEEIANHFGDHHSDSYDKFANQKYHQQDSALLIDGAKVAMVCEVKNISHILGNEEDFLVHVKILSAEVIEDIPFLSREDMR